MALLAVAFGLELVIMRRQAHVYPNFSGDSTRVIRGTDVIRSCLSRHVFTKCGYPSHDPVTDYYGPGSTVYAYPLIQYLIVLASDLHGHAAYYALMVVNTISVFALSLFAIPIARRNRLVGFVYLGLILASPYLFYADLGTSEPVAAALFVVALWRLYRRAHPVELVAWFFLASITKEISFPFVIIGALFVPFIESQFARYRSQLAGAAAGVGAGYIASGLFNIFRFGQWTNLSYNAKQYRVGTSVAVRYFGSLVFAPNGGLAWFWPLFALPVLGMLYFVVKGDRRDRWASLLWFSGVLILLASLSYWYTPFGWNAWGPRLCLGFLAGFGLLAALFVAERVDWSVRPRFVVGFFLVCTLLIAPHVAARADNRKVALEGILTQPWCKAHSGNSPVYVACSLHVLWAHRPLVLFAPLKNLTDDAQEVELALFAAALLAFGWSCARPEEIWDATGPPPDSPS